MENAEQDHMYLQVIEQLKQEINDGDYPEGDRFPSEFQLAISLDVNLSLVRKAIQTLLKEKVLIQKHGVGLFINPKPLFSSGIEELSSVSTMIRQAGMEPGTIFVDFTETEASDESAASFPYEEGDKVMTIKRVRTANGQPVVFCVDQVLAKNLSVEAEQLLNISIFDAIEQNGNIYIDQAVAQIEPIGYDEEASSILRCGIEVPLLALEQKHYCSEGKMVLYSKNYFRADKFSFHVIRKRV